MNDRATRGSVSTQPAGGNGAGGLVWDGRLTAREVTLFEGDTTRPGETYFRLVRGQFFDVTEAQGLHHIYVDTLDEAGRPLPGVQMRVWWGDDTEGQYTVGPTENKPGDRGMFNFPMYSAGRAYGVRVQDGKGDRIFGMGLGGPEHPEWQEHVCYKLTFQRVRAGGQPDVPPTAPPSPQPVDDERATIAARLRELAADANHLAGEVEALGMARG